MTCIVPGNVRTPRQLKWYTPQGEAEIVKAGGRAHAVFADVGTMAGAAALIDAAVETFGRLDILVNNAGFGATVTIEHMGEEEHEGLADFRRHVGLDQRHSLGVRFAAFEAAHVEGVPVVDQDPKEYVRENS